MTVESAPEPGTVRPVDERDLVPKRRLIGYLGAYLGAFLILVVPVASTLAIKVAEVAPDNRESTLGIISGVGAFVAMVSNPIMGALSDRTSSRFGMRRPWIVGGVVVGVAALMVLAFGGSVLVVGASWAVVQFSLNAVTAGLAAFIPDQVPEAQRGKVSALTGIAQQVAPFLGLLIANLGLAVGGGTAGMFVAPSAVGLALVLAYSLRAPDRILPAHLRQPFRLSMIFKAFAFNPKANPDFGWAWLGRFLITMAFAFGSTYQVYFLNTRLDIPMAQVATLQLGFSLLSTVLLIMSASVAGTVSDRIGRRKVFVFAASALIAAGSLVTAFSFSLPMYIIGAALTGIAVGAYFAVDLALVTDVLPDKEGAAAKDMGIFNIANALPQSLAPAVAPLLLSIGGGSSNYIALYVGAAVVALVGALTVVPIKKVR